MFFFSSEGPKSPAAPQWLASFMRAKKVPIQTDKLSEETSVRIDPPVFFHGTNSLHQGESLLQHQVCQDQGGRTAHSYMTMHQNMTWRNTRQIIKSCFRLLILTVATFFVAILTSSAKSCVNKVCSWLEVAADVKIVGVIRLYAHVGDLQSLVDVRTSSTFTVSCVKDMSDSMPG